MHADGASTAALVAKLGKTKTQQEYAYVEACLHLSPEVTQHGELWVARSGNRKSRVLAEIRRYADASGKRIFRVSSALSSLPPQEHPTAEDLKSVLAGSNGEFELLPNAMIKKVDR